MEKEVSIFEIFRAFESAPIEAVMEMVLEPLPKQKRDLLLFKTFSFNRGADGMEWLKADFNIRPFCDEEGEDPEDRWVSASIIFYPPLKLIIRHYCTRDNLPRETLEECIDHYFKS